MGDFTPPVTECPAFPTTQALYHPVYSLTPSSFTPSQQEAVNYTYLHYKHKYTLKLCVDIYCPFYDHRLHNINSNNKPIAYVEYYILG